MHLLSGGAYHCVLSKVYQPVLYTVNRPILIFNDSGLIFSEKALLKMKREIRKRQKCFAEKRLAQEKAG